MTRPAPHSAGRRRTPKTTASERTLELADVVVAVLRNAKPLHATEETFVFTNTDVRPIFVDNFGKMWHPALRAVGLRPRKFYATRHTFISLALTKGARIKWVAEYCGTSVAMIEAHYGRYLGGDSRAQLALLGTGHQPPSLSAAGDVQAPRSATLGATCSQRPGKRSKSTAERGGFEPPVPRGHTRFRVVPFQPGSRTSPA